MPEISIRAWFQARSVLFWSGLIFLIALVLRLQGIAHSPPSLYWEEVALGYDAYSIIETGKDHHGNAWPIVAFPSFGDYKPSLYFYTLVPSITTFGLTPVAVRLPAALASSFTVALTSWLAWRWSRSRLIAGWSGVLLAVQPWSLVVGRAGFETNLAVFLIVAGVALIEAGQTTKPISRTLIYALAAALFALSAFAYHAGRVWGPAAGVLLFFTLTAWSQLTTSPHKWLFEQLKTWLLAAVVAVVLLFPILRELGSPAVQQRVNQTSILSNNAPLTESLALKTSLSNVWWSRLAFHRWWGRALDLTTSYSSHFSPSFLFGKGEINPRHTSQFFGALAPWEIFTVGAGVVALLFAWPGTMRGKHILIGLILVSPTAAMFTLTTPHALRALLLAPWLAILSATGMVFLVRQSDQVLQRVLPRQNLNWKPFLWMLVSGGVLLSTLIFWLYLRFVYPVATEQEWQYGYQEVISSLRQHQLPEERIYMTTSHGRPAMYVFFFEKTDPRLVQAASPIVAKDQLEFLEFQEWSFVGSTPELPGLYALPGDREIPTSVEVLDTITGQSGEPLWVVARRP